MYYLLSHDQPCGTSDVLIPDEQLPIGVTCIDSSLDAPVETIYYDSRDLSVHLRPAQPTPLHVWDLNALDWVLPQETQAESASANWEGLYAALKGSLLLDKVLSAATTIAASNAFTLFYGSLTIAHSEDDLSTSLARLRKAMKTDFTSDEIGQINSLLEANSFCLRLE